MKRKGNALAELVGIKIDTATMEDGMEILLKTRNKITIWSSNPTPRHISWGNKNWKRDKCILLFTEVLFTIARIWKWPRCSLIDERIKNLWYIYTMEYYSAIKTNAIESVLMKWMNLEPITQSEVRQKEKDKYCILTHIYVI